MLFNKIDLHAQPMQVAADKEAVGASVHMYQSMCILPKFL